MNDILFVILRRLRRPLVILIIAYAIAVWGLVLIPGRDSDGHVVHLGFFHAFYIISYTATTIGFGEIPFAFTDAQRAWTTFSLYLSVTSWAYALGSIFHLARDQIFLDAMTRRRFAAQVWRMQEPFVLIVGYGQSGIMLARMLDRTGQRMVIVESRRDRAASIEIDEFEHPPLFLAADGRLPDVLVDAGVTHRKCMALVALAGGDDTNQSVAIGGAALNPSMRIIARVHSQIARSNLESFKKIETINPFESFANNMRLDMGSPDKLRVVEWLSGLPGGRRPEPLNLPLGHWVVCGFGSFGRYVAAALDHAGATWTAIDNDPSIHNENPAVLHHGDAQENLLAAGIEHAVGLIACTDNAPVNLASVTRARAINPDLYVVIRQTHVANASLIDASMANLRFIQAEVVSHKIRQLLTSPLLIRFMKHLDADTGDLAHRAGAMLEAHVGENVPYMWVFDCYASYRGLREALAPDVNPPLSIADLLIDPENPPERLNAVPLLLLRKKSEIPLPAETTTLLSGDRILFAGQQGVEEAQRRFLLEPSPLEYVRTGVEPVRSWVFRKLLRKNKPDTTL